MPAVIRHAEHLVSHVPGQRNGGLVCQRARLVCFFAALAALCLACFVHHRLARPVRLAPRRAARRRTRALEHELVALEAAVERQARELQVGSIEVDESVAQVEFTVESRCAERAGDRRHGGAGAGNYRADGTCSFGCRGDGDSPSQSCDSSCYSRQRELTCGTCARAIDDATATVPEQICVEMRP